LENRKPISEQIFGHNKAPLEEVLKNDFADLEKEVDEAVAKIKARPTKIKDETDFAAVGRLAIDAGKLTKRIDGLRKDETTPLYNAQKDIKAHFDLLAAKIETAVQPHQREADNYTREKAAREKRAREEEAKRLRDKEDAERQKAETATGSAAARAEGRAEAIGAQADAAERAANISAADAVRTKVAGGGVATAKQSLAFEITDYDAIDLNKLRPYFNRDHVEAAIRSMVRVQKMNTNLPGVDVRWDTKAAFR